MVNSKNTLKQYVEKKKSRGNNTGKNKVVSRDLIVDQVSEKREEFDEAASAVDWWMWREQQTVHSCERDWQPMCKDGRVATL